MANLQKQPLPVTILGLDQKANPRTAAIGTIVDGKNWIQTKDNRIEKRPGSAAISMVDASGATISGGRELGALNSELVLRTRSKWYAREAAGGPWMARGYAALERLDIRPLIATEAMCNGRDSFLQMDSATIGNFVLTVMAGGNAAGNASANGWILSDAVTGEALIQRQQLPYNGLTVTTDGGTVPSFVAFMVDGGILKAQVWDQTTFHRTIVGLTNIVTDVSVLKDWNAYGLQAPGASAYPYAVVRVAENVWLVAYHNAAGNIVVCKATRTSGASFTVSAPVVAFFTGTTTSAATLAWSFSAGDSTAELIASGGGVAPVMIETVDVALSDLTISGYQQVIPDAWNTASPVLANTACRGITGLKVGQHYFLFDIVSADGTRNVWLWRTGTASVVLVWRNCGLLTHAYLPTGGDADELCVGVAFPSEWQPSAFLMRLHVSSGTWTRFSIGAHLQNGDFAGRPMAQRLPSMSATGSFALGILNEPVSPGGPGTVMVAIASTPATTTTTVSQPAQAGDSLVIPGGVLKAYDGLHVTEAAFPLGPDSLTAVESTAGVVYGVTAGKVITLAQVPQESADLTSASGPLQVETAASSPGSATWPAGVVTLDFWAKIVTPEAGVTYYLERGASPESYQLLTDGLLAWQNGTLARVALTTDWQHFRYSVPVKSLAAGGTARLIITFFLSTAGGAIGGGVLHVNTSRSGSLTPISIETPWPVLENGVRQYCACLAWTDARGRTQRSQITPPVSVTTAAGLATGATVPCVTITERDPVSNLDAGIHRAVVEVYRTAVSAEIFYRVGSIENVVNQATVYLLDATPDVDITQNERLYTTGGVVENWPPRGCNLVASHEGRVFVCTSDNQVMFSAYLQAGEALAFAAEYQAETAHIPGDITALLSLDDKLAICSQAGPAALAGIGPESTGVPAYDSPMFLASGFGPIGQRSCVRTPRGWEVMTKHGVQLLGRGLDMTPVGFQVDVDAPGSSSWYAAIYNKMGDQVRFSTAGLVLVHDYTVAPAPNRVGQWFRWTYPSDIVAWVEAGGLLFQLTAAGPICQGDIGTDDTGTLFQEWIKLAVVNPGGPNGWARIYSVRFACTIAAGNTLKVTFGAEEGNFLLADDVNTVVASTGALQHVIAKPRYGKVSSTTIWIGENSASATSGFVLDALTLLVGNKGGLGRLPTTNRMTRSA